jgi:protein involved in polysaccharide export with SLBB domain
MKKIGRILIVVYLIISFSSHSSAQSLLQSKDLSSTHIDSYSDEEIKALQLKLGEMNMSEGQLYKLAEDRGLPPAEINKLRIRLESPTLVQSKSNSKSLENSIAVSEQVNSAPVAMQSFDNDNSIFGSELFTKNSLVFEPNLRIATPAGYILGPDDEITIAVYGVSEKNYSLSVNAEGYIYILNVGPLYVNGMSIEEATGKIKAKLASTIYSAIRSGQTKVQVSLSKIRSIRVTVIGEAKKPGTFTVSSLTTLYNILYLCGGPSTLGSYRNIEVVRGNEIKRTADLYTFLLKGNQKDNVLLKEGDVIRIPFYKTRVSINGQVKRPGKFELQKDEKFSDLIEYCGGFTDQAYRASVSISRITEKEKKIIDLESSRFASFIVNGSDEFFVGRLLDRFENRVVLNGAVVRPGSFELSSGLTVKALIERAGGITSDAFTKRVSIFRYLPNKLPIIFSINLDSVLNYNKEILLNKDDSIHIHSIFDFHEQAYVTLEGNVRIPGNIILLENMSLRDVLLSSGTLKSIGNLTRIEISRRIKGADVSRPDYLQTNVFTADLFDKNDRAVDLLLQPYDIINVKAIPGYSAQRMVLVQGEVQNPGRYSLQKSGDRISDLIKRTGGFFSTADSGIVIIRRSPQSGLSVSEREKIFQRLLDIDMDSIASNDKLRDEIYKNYDIIGVNLQQAIKDPESSQNLVLEAGDIITINRASNLVKVSGEVFYPTVIPFKNNAHLKYYINKAGGFNAFARKTSAFVVYPNGSAKSIKHFLFFKSYPKVTPRSEIFAPHKVKSNARRMGATEWAVIVSTLGIVASLIKVIFP